MDDIGFFYIAYTIIWVGIFAYVLRIFLDQQRLTREVEVLKEVVEGGSDE